MFFHILGTIIPTDYIGLKAPTRYCRQNFMTSSSSLFERATDRPGIPVSGIPNFQTHPNSAYFVGIILPVICMYVIYIYIHIMGIYIYIYMYAARMCIYICISYLIISYHILSYLIISYHILSYLIISYHILSHLHKLCHYGCFFSP